MSSDTPTEAGADRNPVDGSPQSTSAQDTASLKAAWRRGLSLDAPGGTAAEQRPKASDPHPRKS